jgi:hypothetical protein
MNCLPYLDFTIAIFMIIFYAELNDQSLLIFQMFFNLKHKINMIVVFFLTMFYPLPDSQKNYHKINLQKYFYNLLEITNNFLNNCKEEKGV